MTEVTDEMVEAGWAAMREAMQGECLQELADGSCDNPVSCQCRREVRAALSAALPLVVAGERERCAKIADEHSLQSEIERKVERKRGGAEWIAHKRAEAIAAAIRSDTGGET